VQRADATNLRLVGGAAGGPSDAVPSNAPVLRLLPRTTEPPSRPPRDARQHRAAQRAVSDENRAAAGLAPDDARSILAARVAESIEGGRAAVLRPIARRNLVAVGAALGLRPFDTSLVIAIMQDRARAGDATPAPDDARLSMIPSPGARAVDCAGGRGTVLVALLGAAALALGLFAALVRWVTRS